MGMHTTKMQRKRCDRGALQSRNRQGYTGSTKRRAKQSGTLRRDSLMKLCLLAGMRIRQKTVKCTIGTMMARARAGTGQTGYPEDGSHRTHTLSRKVGSMGGSTRISTK